MCWLRNAVVRAIDSAVFKGSRSRGYCVVRLGCWSTRHAGIVRFRAVHTTPLLGGGKGQASPPAPATPGRLVLAWPHLAGLECPVCSAGRSQGARSRVLRTGASRAWAPAGVDLRHCVISSLRHCVTSRLPRSSSPSGTPRKSLWVPSGQNTFTPCAAPCGLSAQDLRGTAT